MKEKTIVTKENDLPKLVRDKIPEIIAQSKTSVARIRISDSDTERKDFILKKLREETKEFIEDPCEEEAADVYEVFLGMCETWNLDFQEVLKIAGEKRASRGGFENFYILESVDDHY